LGLTNTVLDVSQCTQLRALLVRLYTRVWRALFGVVSSVLPLVVVMRMHSVTSTSENGVVFLQSQAPWLDDYLRELAAFPNGKHDDQVDSTSQALDSIKQYSTDLPLLTYYEQQAIRDGIISQRLLEKLNAARASRRELSVASRQSDSNPSKSSVVSAER